MANWSFLRRYYARIFAGMVLLTSIATYTSAHEPAKIDLAKLPAAASREVDFAKDIQPIFANSCYDCHGPDAQEAGLRLDVKKKALDGADSGAVIVPGKSVDSLLVHLVAGLGHEKVKIMPPEDMGDPLSAEQVGLLRAWIDQGAKWPDELAGDATKTAWDDHWSFQPIIRPAVPAVKNSAWVRNPIDAFVLQKLEEESVEPSVEADRPTLIRRAYLDLIGLPPKPEELAAFLADERPDAYEHMIDRLLESPHYGERWGRYWLDVARYADSDGYEKDLGRPYAWRYRDWVIDAFNRDLPFDVFTVQQLAGDMLKPGDPEYDPAARIATGFHRNTLLNKEGGVDPEEDRVKRTIDRTNTLGTAWLGLTVGCANCHTHKYDPISQREYFQLYAFFNNIDELDVSIRPEEMIEEMPDLTPREILPEEAEDELARPATPSQPAPKPAKKVKKTEIEVRNENALKLAQTVAESKKGRETFVHLRGDFLSPGPKVSPASLEILPPLTTKSKTPNRLDLARWIVAPENPLTARVEANRLWMRHFSRGIVATPEDFGTQGEKPSHPELLDWLAAELRDGGWRLKRMHSLILTSATYRQSSAARPELVDRDPYNTWLARQNRIRVEAELVRDLALASGGLLSTKIGGQSVRPPQPPGVSEVTYDNAATWIESLGADRYRRGMYIWFQRTSPYPSLVTFDAPDANLSCVRRERSNTPLQSLTLLNDVVFTESAQALGRRMAIHSNEVVSKSQSEDEAKFERFRYGYRLCLCREPSEKELKVLSKLYDAAIAECRADPTAAAKLTGEEVREASKLSSQAELEETAACVAVARAILNLDEFITRE